MNGQKQINDNISRKFLANDKILESMAAQLEGFNSVIKNQLSFNKMIETQVAQLASSCPNINAGKLPGQPEVLLALLKYPFYPLFNFDNGMNLISESLTILTLAQLLVVFAFAHIFWRYFVFAGF